MDSLNITLSVLINYTLQALSSHLFVEIIIMIIIFFFFFKQKTAYEIGTGDWSSDVCSSDLDRPRQRDCHEKRDVPTIKLDPGARWPQQGKRPQHHHHNNQLPKDQSIRFKIGRASCRERV